MLMPRSMKKYGAMPKNASTNEAGNDAEREADADHQAVHDRERRSTRPSGRTVKASPTIGVAARR